MYKHPLYKYPSLYNDIAIVELGRRIEYDFGTYGDTPTCIDKPGQDNVNKLATVQGYGITEDGEVGNLLETNVTVITNDQCKEYFKHNITLNKAIKRQIERALSNGLDESILCTQGHMTEDGVFTEPCKRDSGGSLTIHDDMGKQTLIGVVSGGVGCGKGVPSWYSKVSHYYPWIDCIIQTSRDNMGKVDIVREKCDKVALDLVPPCISPEDLLFADDTDLRLPLCKN